MKIDWYERTDGIANLTQEQIKSLWDAGVDVDGWDIIILLPADVLCVNTSYDQLVIDSTKLCWLESILYGYGKEPTCYIIDVFGKRQGVVVI